MMGICFAVLVVVGLAYGFIRLRKEFGLED